jgi:hypothetical protein
MPTWSSASSPEPKYWRSRSVTMGITLRLTEIRGCRSQPASAQAVRYRAICSACNSSKGTPVSSTSRVELIRFIPCCAVHSAVARVPEPHQMRSDRPGDCGWIASRPLTPPVMRGSASTTVAPEIAARNRAVFSRARSASVDPSGGTYPNASDPRSAVSGDPRLTPSCSRPSLSRSAAAASSAMYSGFS